jgi:hypothetical protein
MNRKPQARRSHKQRELAFDYSDRLPPEPTDRELVVAHLARLLLEAARVIEAEDANDTP